LINRNKIWVTKYRPSLTKWQLQILQEFRGTTNKDTCIIKQQHIKDSARTLVRDYVIISIFSVNSFFFFNPNGLPIHQYGTWPSRVSTFPAGTNVSLLIRQLQNRALLTHEILSSILPSICDIFVTVVGLLRHGVTITYLP
jgi:hypothetical protein